MNALSRRLAKLETRDNSQTTLEDWLAALNGDAAAEARIERASPTDPLVQFFARIQNSQIADQ